MKDKMFMECAIMERFKVKAKELMTECGFEFSTTRTSYVTVSRYGYIAQYTLYIKVDKKDFDIEIRLTSSQGSLEVGWRSNTLLRTHMGDFMDEQIKTIEAVARILEKEAQWRELIDSVDISPVIEVIKGEKEAQQRSREEDKKRRLKEIQEGI